MDNTTDIARVLGSVEQAVRHLDGTLQRMQKVLDDHATRINSLEQSKAWVKGAWFVGGAVLAFIAAALGLPL